MDRVHVCSTLLLVVLIVAWDVVCRVGGVSALIIPTPLSVGEVLWHGLVTGYLWPHVWITGAEMLLGLALGCGIGFVCGVLLGEIDVLRRLLWPYVIASQVIPKLALGPLFIIWFGFGMTSTVVITALICFFPLLENTLTGLQLVDSRKRDLFRMLGATRLQTLFRLRLPTGLPVILAGVRVAVVLALVGAVVGEFIGGRKGLGAAIIAAQGMMDSALMFALFIIITVLGMTVYQLTIVIERGLLRHHGKGISP